MHTDEEIKLGTILESVANQLDISPSDYQRAVSSYKYVGSWLEDGHVAGNYPGSIEAPSIYPQGSINLGTVVRPIRAGKDPAYDVDLVCELQFQNMDPLPENARIIKHQVGARLRTNATFNDKLSDEGCRCWTLEYAKNAGIGFHIDILPCVPDSGGSIGYPAAYLDGFEASFSQTCVALTHRDIKDQRTVYDWRSSNPKGYAKWFASRNVSFNALAGQQRQMLFENARDLLSSQRLYESVADVPDQLIRTPLQRAIQILKRHRDLCFKNDPKYQPISMIITTLAARIYQGESDTYSAVTNIMRKLCYHEALLEGWNMPLHASVMGTNLIRRDPEGNWIIANPINGNENFADRWHEDDDARARQFFFWLRKLQGTLDRFLKKPRDRDILLEDFGNKEVEAAMKGDRMHAGAIAVAAVPHVEIRKDPAPSKNWGCRVS